MVGRRRPARLGALTAFLLLAPTIGADVAEAAEGWPRRVTDMLGREVVLERRPRRVLLTEGRQLTSLGLITPDPVGLLAGIGDDLRASSPSIHAAAVERFPALASVPVVGSGPEALSLETALSVDADVAVVSAWQVPGGQGNPIVQTLTDAGLPVVVVDFFEKPLERTLPSLRVLGRTLGLERGAEAFADFYERRLARLTDRLGTKPAEPPTVMLHAYPGHWPCCWTTGGDNLGEFLALLGAHNIGADRFPNAAGGQLSPEYVITRDPDVYIATGLPELTGPGSLSIGQGVSKAAARAALEGVVAEPGLDGLSAGRAGRVHGIWNFLNGGPLGIVALEAFARWLRPDRFGDIDPVATLAEINRRFSAVPFEGTFTVSLSDRRDPKRR